MQRRCPCCNKSIMDGGVILCRVLRFDDVGKAEAKCTRCKHWVVLPITILPGNAATRPVALQRSGS
jgi:hypothetical protein